MFIRPDNRIKFGLEAIERRNIRAKANFVDDSKKEKEPFADAVKRHLEAIEFEESGRLSIKTQDELPMISK